MPIPKIFEIKVPNKFSFISSFATIIRFIFGFFQLKVPFSQNRNFCVMTRSRRFRKRGREYPNSPISDYFWKLASQHWKFFFQKNSLTAENTITEYHRRVLVNSRNSDFLHFLQNFNSLIKLFSEAIVPSFYISLIWMGFPKTS